MNINEKLMESKYGTTNVNRLLWLIENGYNFLLSQISIHSSLECNLMARIKQTILKLPHTKILCTHNYYLTLYYLLEQKMYSRNYIIFQQTCALICFRPKYPSNRSNEAYHTILWHIDTNIFWNVFFKIERKVCNMK